MSSREERLNRIDAQVVEGAHMGDPRQVFLDVRWLIDQLKATRRALWNAVDCFEHGFDSQQEAVEAYVDREFKV